MRVIMPFINDNKIDTRSLCEESKKYLEGKGLIKPNTILKKLDLDPLPDDELGLKTQIILEELKRIEGKNVGKMKERAKTAKNRLIKSISGLLGLSVVLLTLVSVALFVPAVTAMAAAALAAILATGPFALPLLITAGIILSGLTIVPSLIFAWKKYKSNRAHNKSMSIVTELTSKLDQLNPRLDPSNDKGATSNVYGSGGLSRANSNCSFSSNSSFSSSSDEATPTNEFVNYVNLAEQLKNALAWRIATLEKDPDADASYGAYIRYCNNCDQTDSGNNDQIDSTKFEKLYNKFQGSNLDKIDASSVEAALKTIEQEIKPNRDSTSSSFYKLAEQLSPQELSTADQDFDDLARNMR